MPQLDLFIHVAKISILMRQILDIWIRRGVALTYDT